MQTKGENSDSDEEDLIFKNDHAHFLEQMIIEFYHNTKDVFLFFFQKEIYYLQFKECQTSLINFFKNSDNWKYGELIFSNTQNAQSKFMALKLIEKVIKVKSFFKIKIKNFFSSINGFS